MSTSKRVMIYTRGVTSPSGRGGYGVILLCDGHRKQLSGSAADSSNNRMDLLAAVEGLRALKFPCGVTVYNTNTYLTDAISKGWALRWRSKGWRSSEQRPTPHADLWEALLGLCVTHEATFEWLPFDSTDGAYRDCNALAHAAALGGSTPVNADFLPITLDLIEAAKSERGGWSKRQLACLGVAWPPPSGWKVAAAGRLIRRTEAETFLHGRIKANAPELFE